MRLPPVIIHDATALIDLANGGLLEVWTSMEADFLVTDFVVNEVRQEAQANALAAVLASGGMTLVTISPKDMTRVFMELQQIRDDLHVSIADASAYRLAREHAGVLVTGDRRLRAGAVRNGVKVRGALWILDQLVDHELLSPSGAANALQQVIANGSWLPTAECATRFHKWIGPS